MTLIIPPGFGQCAHRFSLAGDPEVMIFTCGVDVSGAGGDFQDLAETLAQSWISAVPNASMSDEWTYLGVRLLVGQDGTPPVVVDAPVSNTGSAGFATPPQNCAVLVTKQTGAGGRANRGRMYIPPALVNESDVTAVGMLINGLQEGIQDVVDVLFEFADPYVLHDSTSPVSTPTAITNFVVQSQIATQRRRLR